jgi:hypothetical protein
VRGAGGLLGRLFRDRRRQGAAPASRDGGWGGVWRCGDGNWRCGRSGERYGGMAAAAVLVVSGCEDGGRGVILFFLTNVLVS